MIAYALASIVYRWILVALLVWFCYRVLVPYRLETLAVLLGVSAIGGMLAGPVLRGVRFARTPTIARKVPRRRLVAVGTVVSALSAAAALVPLPVRVTAPVVIEPLDARRVYVSEPGTLEFAVRAGQVVQAGETLARLASTDLELEVTRIAGQRDRQRLRLENLERRRGQDRAAAAEIPTAQEALADLDERLAQRQADRDRLTLTAPIGGTVLPPEWNSRSTTPGALPAWRGTPLRPHNQVRFWKRERCFA